MLNKAVGLFTVFPYVRNTLMRIPFSLVFNFHSSKNWIKLWHAIDEKLRLHKVIWESFRYLKSSLDVIGFENISWQIDL